MITLINILAAVTTVFLLGCFAVIIYDRFNPINHFRNFVLVETFFKISAMSAIIGLILCVLQFI